MHTLFIKLAYPVLFLHYCYLGLISLLLLSGCSLTSPINSTEITAQQAVHHLDGKWAFSPGKKPKHANEWQSINVPANWYKEGHDISGQAWYQRHFFASHDLDGKKVTLLLKGIDYQADIWLNDIHLAKQEGYFQETAIDLTPAIKLGQTNKLTLKVDSPLEKPQDFSLRKRLLKGIFSHHDTRPGGAWSDRGQEKNTGGIWNSVEIHTSQDLYIKQVSTRAEKTDNTHWTLHATIHSEGESSEAINYHWTLEAYNHEAPPLSGIAQQPEFSITVDNPALWWPKHLGAANLYHLHITAKKGQQILHSKTIRTAFRHIELDDQKVWSINGQRMLLMGTNYIPTQWLSELDASNIQRDIDLMLEANINTVRVHAHITHPEFYRQCDERGLLVWQDFPLQWGYQDTPEFHEQAHLQLKDMLRQLGNHPSIIHWTLHNEPPWDADWMKWKYPDYDPKQNHELDLSLNALANKLEKSRPISMMSSTREHPWLGWYSGHWLDYAKPTTQAFISEFGSQALPDAAALTRIFGEFPTPPKQQKNWKGWEKWQYHNFQPKESFEIAKIAYPKNTQELIKNSQHYQVRLIQLAAESYRRQAYQPVTALFHFMFVEDWPSMNWGIVDYWRHTKPGYAALQRAYQPILPSIEWQQIEYPEGTIELGLWLLNDSADSYENIRYQLSLLKGQAVIDEKNYQYATARDTHKKVAQYISPALTTGDYLVKTRIINQQGVKLSENEYRFSVKSTAKTEQ